MSVVFARHVTFVVVVLKAADVGADGGHLCECQQPLLHRQSHPHRQSRCPASQIFFCPQVKFVVSSIVVNRKNILPMHNRY